MEVRSADAEDRQLGLTLASRPPGHGGAYEGRSGAEHHLRGVTVEELVKRDTGRVMGQAGEVQRRLPHDELPLLSAVLVPNSRT